MFREETLIVLAESSYAEVNQMKPLLKVANLHTYYYLREGILKAVSDVSFEINKSESLGLVGESGCGKSTAALSIMNSVPKPGKILKGRITLDSIDVLSKNEKEMRILRWKDVSMVIQAVMSGFNPVYKISDQIMEAILIHENISKREARERCIQLLCEVGLSPSWLDSYPHELSGGMKQRAFLAMAICCSPKLLIADEPTTALDVMVQAQIVNLMKRLQKERKLSILLVTHDIALTSELCDKIAVMYAGKLVEICEVEKFFQDPKHPYSMSLIKSTPSLLGKQKQIEGLKGFPPSLIDLPPGCSFHPRCPFAKHICSEEAPLLIPVKNHGKVACHLVENHN